MRGDLEGASHPDHGEGRIADVAQNVLQIRLEQRNALFHPNPFIERPARPADAIATLRHLRRTDKVRWIRASIDPPEAPGEEPEC